MRDVDGPRLAQVFYRELFTETQDQLHPDVVAHALSAAVKELRRLGLPPHRWAPYIHIGI